MSEQVRDLVTWLLVLALALASADAVTAMVERALELPAREMASEFQPAPSPSPLTARVAHLLSLEKPAPVSVVSASPIRGTASLSFSQVRLLGVMRGEEQGLAALEVDGRPRVLELGRSVGGWTLGDLGERHATLARGEQVLKLELGAEPSPAVGPAPERSALQVPRRDLVSALENPTGQARIIPQRELGIRLLLSSTDHVLYRLGLRSGDLITSLNELELRGATSLSEAVRLLRNSTHLRLEVERGGESLTLRVELI